MSQKTTFFVVTAVKTFKSCTDTAKLGSVSTLPPNEIFVVKIGGKDEEKQEHEGMVEGEEINKIRMETSENCAENQKRKENLNEETRQKEIEALRELKGKMLRSNGGEIIKAGINTILCATFLLRTLGRREEH
jgi:hypothetical protein